MNIISVWIMYGMMYSIPIIIGIVVFFASKTILKKATKERFRPLYLGISFGLSIVVAFAIGIPLVESWYYSTVIVE